MLETKSSKSIVLIFLLLTGLLSVSNDILPMFILTAIAVPFLFVYSRDSSQWWALIPAYVMFAVSGIILLKGWQWSEQLVAPYVLTAVAFPFLIVYFKDRSNGWALIPAYVLLAVAGLVFGEGWLIPEALTGSYVLFAIALPFLYLFGRNHRWALIPGGVMAVIGTGILLETVGIPIFFVYIMGAIGLKIVCDKFSLNAPTSKKAQTIDDAIHFSLEDVDRLKKEEQG